MPIHGTDVKTSIKLFDLVGCRSLYQTELDRGELKQ